MNGTKFQFSIRERYPELPLKRKFKAINMKTCESWVNLSKRKIIKIGKKLIRDSRKNKYPFKQYWLNDLLKYYEKQQSKFLINLSDLPDKVCIYFSSKVKDKIREKISRFYSDQSEEKLAQSFGWSLINYLKGTQQSISLGALRQITNKLKFNLSSLEKYIVQIKPSINSKIIQIKLPLNMMSKEGAIILGVFPDIGISRYVLSCKDKELVDQFRIASKRLLGFFKDKKPHNNNGMNRYYATNFLRDVCEIAGYNTNKKQIIGNNSIPLWIFSTPSYFLKMFLQKMWDTDGSVSKMDKRLKFTQSIAFPSNMIMEFIQFNEKTTFKNLPKQFREIVLRKPPFLLISLQLLLMMMGIKSKIYPERVKMSADRLICCEWSLRISCYSDIQIFAKKIGFGLKRKEETLKNLLLSYREVKLRERYLKILRKIKREGSITIRDLTKVLDLSIGTIRSYLVYLQANGFIFYKVGKLNRGVYRPQGFIYELTKKGNNFLGGRK